MKYGKSTTRSSSKKGNDDKKEAQKLTKLIENAKNIQISRQSSKDKIQFSKNSPEKAKISYSTGRKVKSGEFSEGCSPFNSNYSTPHASQISNKKVGISTQREKQNKTPSKPPLAPSEEKNNRMSLPLKNKGKNGSISHRFEGRTNTTNPGEDVKFRRDHSEKGIHKLYPSQMDGINKFWNMEGRDGPKPSQKNFEAKNAQRVKKEISKEKRNSAIGGGGGNAKSGRNKGNTRNKQSPDKIKGMKKSNTNEGLQHLYYKENNHNVKQVHSNHLKLSEFTNNVQAVRIQNEEEPQIIQTKMSLK